MDRQFVTAVSRLFVCVVLLLLGGCTAYHAMTGYATARVSTLVDQYCEARTPEQQAYYLQRLNALLSPHQTDGLDCAQDDQ